MIERKDLDKRIKTIVGLCQRVMSLSSEFGSDKYRSAENEVWESIWAMDGEARCFSQTPITPGRFLRLPVRDGYARYIVSRVLAHKVKVVYLPFPDNHQSMAVTDGEMPIDAVETILGNEDRVTQAFRAAARGMIAESRLKHLEFRRLDYGEFHG